jgi:hypothetical protein
VREALLVAAARKASRYFRSVICLRSTRPRSQIVTIYTAQKIKKIPRGKYTRKKIHAEKYTGNTPSLETHAFFF